MRYSVSRTRSNHNLPVNECLDGECRLILQAFCFIKALFLLCGKFNVHEIQLSPAAYVDNKSEMLQFSSLKTLIPQPIINVINFIINNRSVFSESLFWQLVLSPHGLRILSHPHHVQRRSKSEKVFKIGTQQYRFSLTAGFLSAFLITNTSPFLYLYYSLSSPLSQTVSLTL